MKKVYLVYASLFYEDGSHNVILLNVFASAIKAEVYAHYKRLSIVRKGADVVFGYGVDYVEIRLDSESICTVDWSDELKELQQMLCDSIEANKIAEEQRNNEFIKKSNLLEFV